MTSENRRSVAHLADQAVARKFGFDVFANEAGIATHVDELFLMFKAHQIPLETAYTLEDKAVR